jgi:hypothetical protein
MSFKEIAVDSLRYPFTDWKRFLNLFILVFLSIAFSQFIIFAILFSLITGGYLIRIIESTLEDSEKLPEFSNMKKLLMDGLRYLVASIIYSIPVMLVSFLFLGLTAPDATLNMQIIIIVVGFLVNIIFLMGLTNMVKEKTIKGAFQFKKIFKLIKELGWKNYLIYLLFYTLIITVISQIPSLLAPIGFVDPLFLMEDSSSYGFMGYLILQGLLSTYSLAFDGRLRGLIYPRNHTDEDINLD